MSAFLLGIELLDIEPKVRRTVAVPEDASFADLHSIIQSVMQWGDFSYHSFFVGYDFDADGTDDMFVRISDYEGRDIAYLYDPDAGWEVGITWEGRTDDDLGFTPRLVSWEGDAPPEGCYDRDDFLRFLAAVDDPGSPDYAEYAEIAVDWEFDPETAQNSLETWGVQGVMPEGARLLDPMVRMGMVSDMAELLEFPIVFDAEDGVSRYVAEPGKIEESVTEADVSGDPERYIWLLRDPYALFTELADVLSREVTGSGLDGRDPDEVFGELTSGEEAQDLWGEILVGTVSDMTFEWARRNGFYFSADCFPGEGETF